ncbi:hypothetical protein ACH4U5_00930 [Streptomyces sp. NPDC020858]|uniref:hypothetical protein n=1 Tax=Streptomyces sp. NPDC020858 TaxID=3365097 RepID=UPI0037BA7D71
MSDSVPPAEQPEYAPEAGARKRAVLGRLVPRGKRARWVAAGAAVVVVGGGAVVVAVADHHHDHHQRADRGPHIVWSEPGDKGGLKRGPQAAEPPHDREVEGRPGQVGPKLREKLGGPAGPAGPGGLGELRKAAPAPLPSLAIGDAADKAAAAVTGGKVESLRVVGQEGGGSAWLAVVLGPDGVRHAVTVSGTDGTVTSNTTIDR